MNLQPESLSDVIRIQVANPERYWFAVSSEMPSAINPAMEGRIGRHPDRSEIRWALVGELVQELGEMLEREKFSAAPHQPGSSFELVIHDRFHLTSAERKIVGSWFTNAEAPRADPWYDQVDNGRHRMSGVWQVLPDAILPVLSDLLLWDDSADSEPDGFQQGLYVSAKVGSLQVPLDAPVRKRSSAYFERLEYNAAQLPKTPETDAEVELSLMISGHLDFNSQHEEAISAEKPRKGFLRRLFGDRY